ncbi:flagellar biosynthesis regulator FlaF [Celeribacter arenosi]|uniref:Flagellar biosynthesis regulator FlaF n=1 Tax=Celeribacter arenosi TaxID=792649 RepID=A0ABP7JZY3_9RHOB
MNALDMARTAYTNTSAPIRTARGTEYEAFARVTRRLSATDRDKKASYPAFVTALNENRRLWTLLASDVADSNNGLPAQLRAQIFYLAEFTIQHTSAVLNRKAEASALIEINTAVMRGLQTTGGAK